jgi:hypothetical protein
MLAPIDVVRFVALKMGVRQPDQLVLTPKDAELVGKQLRGKQVRSSHNERKWRIRGVADKSARTSRFEDDEGNSITVAEYFFRQYNIVLRLPDLPCLRVGRDSDPVEMPMELCSFLPGQAKHELSADHKVAMIRETCAPPDARLESLRSIVAGLGKDETSRAFGVATEVGLKAVPARILDPLPLVYRDMQGHEAAVHPDTYKGQWNMRSRGADLAMARCCPPLTTWVIISFVRKEMMTDQVHDLGRGSNTGRRPHTPTHTPRTPPRIAHHPLTARSPPAHHPLLPLDRSSSSSSRGSSASRSSAASPSWNLAR